MKAERVQTLSHSRGRRLSVPASPSVRPSVHIRHNGSHWTHVHEIWYWGLLRESVEKEPNLVKIGQNFGRLTWSPQVRLIYDVICDFMWYVMIYDFMWYDLIWYMILCDMIWYMILCDMIYDMIYDFMWFDMIYDFMWYDMIYDFMWYDIYDIWFYVIWYMILCDMIYDFMWYDMIYDMIWYGMVWYMIWYDMIWYDMIWYDMIWYDMIWYDMIWYDINCNWEATRWQQYSTHIHTNGTQNDTKQTIQRTTQK